MRITYHGVELDCYAHSFTFSTVMQDDGLSTAARLKVVGFAKLDRELTGVELKEMQAALLDLRQPLSVLLHGKELVSGRTVRGPIPTLFNANAYAFPGKTFVQYEIEVDTVADGPSGQETGAKPEEGRKIRFREFL